MKNTNLEQIGLHLKGKGNLKQKVYQKTLSVFDELKELIEQHSKDLNNMCKEDLFDIKYSENGKFEAELQFAGDVLTFNMHTNVFNFPDEFFIHQSPYVLEDENRKYCGMIEVYNFLADSFKYSRYGDSGYLVARIFINHEGHFFIEGEDQLGFLFKDFDNLVMNKDVLALVIEQAMIFSIDFDLWAPLYQEIKEITVGERIQQTGTITHKTSKRLGFVFSNEEKIVD